MTRTNTPKKIGFLGGGQLAQMMALKAHELGHIPYILSGNPNDPAAQVVKHWYKGDIYKQTDLTQFLKKVDIATFESEFLNSQTLAKAIKASKTKIFPRLQNMKSLQDRLSQKKLFSKYNLLTSPFVKVDNFSEAEKAWVSLNGALVLKQRFHGYDGYGTFIIKNKADLYKFKDQINQNPHGFIAEKFISFKRELAISVCRSKNGDVCFLPLVESYQEDARCLWVKGPVKHSQLKLLQRKAKQFLEATNYVGIIAFELFDCGKTLLVNETAPRVHNSAHYTQDALNFDQFSLHLKCILGEKLPKLEVLSKSFAMYNLLGTRKTENFRFPTDLNCHLHWYQKTESRPGRKMGHLNCLDQTADKALNQLVKATKGFQL